MAKSIEAPVARPIQPPSAPICNAPEEVLWHIFMINTEDHSIDQSWRGPLDTARRSSQVCRRWRTILLQTSSIWARLLDGRSLDQKSDHWREEVLRRSGSSLLWIKYPDWTPNRTFVSPLRGTLARLKNPNPRLLLFFRTLIQENWERIQKLSFYVYGEVDYVEVQGVATPHSPDEPSITLPPLLNGNSDRENQGKMPSNYASRLHEFRSMHTYCDLNVAWMSNLRILCLGGNFTNKEVSNILAHTPYLQSLTLARHNLDPDYRCPPIHLPRLQTLCLHRCLMYLRDLIIPIDTTLYLFGPVRYGQNSYEHHIATKLHNRLTATPPSSIDLRYNSLSFVIADTLYHGTFDVKLNSGFYINGLFLQANDERLMDTLASPFFSTVTTLRVQCHGLMERPPLFHHAFKQLLVNFLTVNTLIIHEQDIYILMKHIITDSVSENVLFPMLKHLIVFDFDYSEVFSKCKCRHHPGPASGSIQQFLRLRRKLGIVPIQNLTVDLTTAEYQGRVCRPAPILDPAPDEFLGMNIVWKVDDRIVYIRDCTCVPKAG